MGTVQAADVLVELGRAGVGATDRRDYLRVAVPLLLDLGDARAAVVLREDHGENLVVAEAGSSRVGDPGVPVRSDLARQWSPVEVPSGWAADGISRVLARRLPGGPEVLLVALTPADAEALEAEAPFAEAGGGRMEASLALVDAALARLHAEEELADLRTRVDHAQQLADMGDYDWDIATDTNRWSDQLYRIYGHEPQSFHASYERFLSLVHEEDREPITRVHQAALATGEPYQMVERIVRPDGEVRHLASNGQVVMDSGRPVRMRGTCLDITDQVVAEREHARSAARFEALVEHCPDGILVLDRGRVVQANPVARSLLGGDPVSRTIDDIVEPGKAVAQAVDATGVDGRRLRLDLRTVGLSELDDRAVAVFLHDADPRLAREAMAADLREAQVRQQQAVEINDNVVQGLSAATYALESGDHDHAAAYVGRTLTAARRMMTDLMTSLAGQEVRAGDLVRSEPSSLDRPAAEVPAPAADRGDQEVPQGPRLLLVDDSEDLRMILRLQVERKTTGRVIGEAGDGVRGVELAGELKPDLVLLDLAMPRMDGLEALPLILEAAPGARVIVISGFDQRGLSAQVLAAGAIRYIEKGTSMARIAEIISEVWGEGPAARPA